MKVYQQRWMRSDLPKGRLGQACRILRSGAGGRVVIEFASDGATFHVWPQGLERLPRR